MHTITVRNVHEALPEGVRTIQMYGERRDSRNGPVLVMPGPVTTLYERPVERVLFWSERDANPFFHFAECLWMMAGRNDLAFLSKYIKNFGRFSDDGKTLHGAYGHRWRRHFGFDQLGHIIQALKDNPEDRRNVLQIWDAEEDLGACSLDIPCNTQVYFSRNTLGALDMTVCCRSNDIIFGAYGANAVHFSFLQEYMARAIGCEVGGYWQVSNNYHAYLDTLEPVKCLSDQAADPFRISPRSPYESGAVEPYPIMQVDPVTWQQDLSMFLDEGVSLGVREPFLRKVAHPILAAHKAFRSCGGLERFEVSLEIIEQCQALDWKRACRDWLSRRMDMYIDSQDEKQP